MRATLESRGSPLEGRSIEGQKLHSGTEYPREQLSITKTTTVSTLILRVKQGEGSEPYPWPLAKISWYLCTFHGKVPQLSDGSKLHPSTSFPSQPHLLSLKYPSSHHLAKNGRKSLCEKEKKIKEKIVNSKRQEISKQCKLLHVSKKKKAPFYLTGKLEAKENHREVLHIMK